MHNFTRNLITEWRKLELPFSNQNVVIAVSGGADSMALAFAIFDLFKRKKLKNNFIIAHFNHKLRGKESEKDAEFVKNFAEKMSFEFVQGVAKKNEISKTQNTEQKAREARYTFLQKTAKESNSQIILTAHTLNDQAETFLLNLIRGSGINGLAAMKPIRKITFDSDILIARPILHWAKRTDTEQFALEKHIEFRQDSMNQDENYKRVNIRKNLIPILEKYNPNIIETITNTSKNLRNENDLIEELIKKNADFQNNSNSLNLKIKELKNLTKPMLFRLLQKWLLSKRGNLRNIEQKHLEAIRNLIFSRKSGKIAELPNSEKVIKENGKLIFQSLEVEK